MSLRCSGSRARIAPCRGVEYGKRSRLPPTAHKIIAAAVAIAGVFFVVAGVRMWMRTEGLASRGVVTRARLTEVRERDDSETGIVAKYELEVDGARYHREGLFSEVAADVTPEQAADPTGTIDVRYLPEDPSVNEPVSDVTPTATRPLFAIAGGLRRSVAALVRWMMVRRTSAA